MEGGRDGGEAKPAFQLPLMEPRGTCAHIPFARACHVATPEAPGPQKPAPHLGSRRSGPALTPPVRLCSQSGIRALSQGNRADHRRFSGLWGGVQPARQGGTEKAVHSAGAAGPQLPRGPQRALLHPQHQDPRVILTHGSRGPIPDPANRPRLPVEPGNLLCSTAFRVRPEAQGHGGRHGRVWIRVEAWGQTTGDRPQVCVPLASAIP